MKLARPFAAGAATLFLSVVLVEWSATALPAQSALDRFDPKANAQIDVAAVQPDGKILIGGEFSFVLGAPRKNMARLNTDGTLDTAFAP